MDFLGPTAMNRGGSAAGLGPSRTLNSASFFGGEAIGYVRADGPMATALGISGGTLSGTVLTGYTTDTVSRFSEVLTGTVPLIYVTLMGDAVAALTGLSAITIGGVSCAVSTPPSFDGTVTAMEFTGSAVLVASTSQTIQLI